MYDQLRQWRTTNPTFAPKELSEQLGELGGTVSKYLSRLWKHYPGAISKPGHGQFQIEEGMTGLTFEQFQAGISETQKRADLAPRSASVGNARMIIQAATNMKAEVGDDEYKLDLLDEIIATAELVAEDME